MSTFDQEVQFLGEMPIPEPVGDADSGILALKANADHSHDLTVRDWQNVLFQGTWTWYGGTTRNCEYTRVGNISVLRGVFINPVGQVQGSLMATIPIDYCPQNGMRETFPCYTNAGTGELDIMGDGRILYQGGLGGVTFVLFGTIFWIND